jgi:hypothetical protein
MKTHKILKEHYWNLPSQKMADLLPGVVVLCQMIEGELDD